MPKTNSILAVHMGDSFDSLAPLLQAAHLGKNRLRGLASVQRGNFMARIFCVMFHLPKQIFQVDLTVDCEHTTDSMIWKRNFDGLVMESHFKKNGEYLVEHLGPLAMSFKAVEQRGELHYQFVKTRFFGIPMPNLLSPHVIAFEKEVDNQYQFCVEVKMFLVGLVIAYAGNLQLTKS
jgi:hypothetical protein